MPVKTRTNGYRRQARTSRTVRRLRRASFMGLTPQTRHAFEVQPDMFDRLIDAQDRLEQSTIQRYIQHQQYRRDLAKTRRLRQRRDREFTQRIAILDQLIQLRRLLSPTLTLVNSSTDVYEATREQHIATLPTTMSLAPAC